MKKTKSKEPKPQDAAARQPVQELRDALLNLHKTLIDSERAVYEANVGPIRSSHHFYSFFPAIHGSPGCARFPN
jgi:hypothetical protein